jgi:uncharacterized membrane protein YdjX (TVP38/TMEM64 family)
MVQPSKSRLNSVFKLLLTAVIVAVLIIIANTLNIQGLLSNILLWINDLGPWGPIAFVILYSLATVTFIPGSLLTLGGGLLFGVVFGSIYVFVGAVVGATLAFLIGRYAARSWVSRQLEGKVRFQAIDEAIAREGYKIVLLTRLSPVFPFTLLNYALSMTRVSLRDYLLGFVGMIPGTLMYVYIGSLAGNLAMLGVGSVPTDADTQLLQWGIRILGLLATILVTVYITHVARQALNQSITSQKE